MIQDLFIGEVTTITAIPAPSYLPTIQRGSTGDAVRYAQRVLKERAAQPIVIDGIFGYQTEGAVKNLQSFFKLPITGIVDSKTWGVIGFIGAGSTSGTRYNIKEFVLSMQVSLTMDSVSQITFEVSDPGLKLADANYWNIRRPVSYRGLKFEISAYDIRQGQAGEVVRVEARSAACQQLKRNKGQSLFTGGNGTAYAATKARSVGLKFFGENTTEQATISQTSTTGSEDSEWNVLRRLADQFQFVLFETDGRLFFTSQKFLLGKYAIVDTYTISSFFYTSVRWRTNPATVTTYLPLIPAPSTSPVLGRGSTGEHVTYLQRVLKERAGFTNLAVTGVFDAATELMVIYLQGRFDLPTTGVVDSATWSIVRYLGNGNQVVTSRFALKALECPACRKSDDDPNAATVSFQVSKDQGILMRPGMTVRLMDIPDYNGDYIVTSVEWDEGTVGSVAISARTPIEPTADAQSTSFSGTGGTGTTTFTTVDLAELQQLSTNNTVIGSVSRF